MSSDSLVEQMEKYQQKYYQSHSKNILFKKNQKQDCAKDVSKTFPLEDMINRTIFIVPNKNKLVFDYTIFKLFANNDNYDIILQRVIDNYDTLIAQYSNLEVHIILEGFTISAAERYKYIIQQLCNKFYKSQTSYSQFISSMYLYYTPSMIENISALLKPFINTSVVHDITMYLKADSPAHLKKLFEPVS